MQIGLQKPCCCFTSNVVYRFRYKAVVKSDINADYDTYGQEDDVDYITNENAYYGGDYESMETNQNATVRNLTYFSELKSII